MIDDPPPMTLAWVYQMTRPLRCFCGTVLQQPAGDALCHLREARRHSEKRVPVSASGLQKQDFEGGIGAQAICKHTSGGPTPDDDIVV